MFCSVLLFLLLSIASVTDVWRGKIYNWTTYPGILLAIGGSAVATWTDSDAVNGSEAQVATWGFVHLQDCLTAFLACSAILLLCYVLTMGVGGGDVKLIAMLGAFLGVEHGLRALMWTFIIAACVALIVLVWKYGAIKFFSTVGKYGLYLLRLGPFAKVTNEERKPLQAPLMLAPSALVAAIIVRFDWDAIL